MQYHCIPLSARYINNITMITLEEVIDPIAAKGTVGTSVSFMLADISVVISILVGIVTLAYMTEKWLAMRSKRKGK